MTENFEWQGKVGDVWAEEWQRTDRALGPLNSVLVACASRGGIPRKILDVGCGAGATSLAMADGFPAARVLGIDLSGSLIAVAEQRSRARSKLSFAVKDAAKFDDPLFRPDLIVSRHGVMFFDDPVAAFASLRSAVAEGARLIFSCFRSADDNEWATAIAGLLPDSGPARAGAAAPGPGPFAFADPAHVADILCAAGWAQPQPQTFDFTYLAGEGQEAAKEALEFFSRIGPAARAIRDLAPGEARNFRSRLETLLRERLSGGTVSFKAAAWVWTARASESQA